MPSFCEISETRRRDARLSSPEISRSTPAKRPSPRSSTRAA
jgi:hypothetical protein